MAQELLHDLRLQFPPPEFLGLMHQEAKKCRKACRAYFGSAQLTGAQAGEGGREQQGAASRVLCGLYEPLDLGRSRNVPADLQFALLAS